MITDGMTADQMNALADVRAKERARPELKSKPMPKRTQQSAGRGTAQPGMIRMVTGAYPEVAPPTPLQNTQDASEPTTAGVDAQSTAVALAAIHGLTTAMGVLAGENDPAEHTANALRLAYEAQYVEIHGQSDDDGGLPGPAFGGPYWQGRAARRGAAAWLNRTPQDDLSTAASSEPGDAPPGAARRTPQNLQMSAEEIASATRLTGERLGELMASNPNMSDERLAELGRHFADAPPDADVLSDGIPSDYGPGHED